MLLEDIEIFSALNCRLCADNFAYHIIRFIPCLSRHLVDLLYFISKSWWWVSCFPSVTTFKLGYLHLCYCE